MKGKSFRKHFINISLYNWFPVKTWAYAKRKWKKLLYSMCKCAKSLQSYLTLCDPMDGSPPGSSVHELFQARILEWVAISFSWGSSPPRDWTQVTHIAGRFFTVWAIREVCMTLKLLQLGLLAEAWYFQFTEYTHTHTCTYSYMHIYIYHTHMHIQHIYNKIF